MDILVCEKCGWTGRDDDTTSGTTDDVTVRTCPECQEIVTVEFPVKYVPITPGGLHELLDEILGD